MPHPSHVMGRGLPSWHSPCDGYGGWSMNSIVFKLLALGLGINMTAAPVRATTFGTLSR